MLRPIAYALVCLVLLVACHHSKKSTSTASRPKPRPSAPAKPPASGPAKDPSKELVFVESDRLSPVLERAQKEKKPVFVEFYADWCAPCKVMEEEVFTQKQTFGYLNKNFLNYKVDFDSPNGKTIASIYEVKSLPTILFLDPKGVALERKTGMATHTILTTLGDSALKKMK